MNNHAEKVSLRTPPNFHLNLLPMQPRLGFAGACDANHSLPVQRSAKIIGQLQVPFGKLRTGSPLGLKSSVGMTVQTGRLRDREKVLHGLD